MTLSSFPNFHDQIISSQILDWTPKLLLLLSAAPDLNEGIFTNISHEPTWRWYFAITPFEAFFLGIILTQFAVLNLLGFMPLNLNAIINGMPNGRRKREAFSVSQRKRDIAGQLLKLMKKLDPDECSFKAICELEAFDTYSPKNGTEIPPSIRAILLGLKQITKKRDRGELFFAPETADLEAYNKSLKDMEIPGIDKGEDDVISLYEASIKIGDSVPNAGPNATSPCEVRYHRCPVNGDEILGYIRMMESIDELLEF